MGLIDNQIESLVKETLDVYVSKLYKNIEASVRASQIDFHKQFLKHLSDQMHKKEITAYFFLHMEENNKVIIPSDYPIRSVTCDYTIDLISNKCTGRKISVGNYEQGDRLEKSVTIYENYDMPIIGICEGILPPPDKEFHSGNVAVMCPHFLRNIQKKGSYMILNIGIGFIFSLHDNGSLICSGSSKKVNELFRIRR